MSRSQTPYDQFKDEKEIRDRLDRLERANATARTTQLDFAAPGSAPDAYIKRVGPGVLEVSGLTSGGATIGDKNYLHTQVAPASTWTIVHNLGKYPAVAIIDSAGDLVHGDVHYDSTNQVTLTFGSAFSGTASLN